MREFQFDMLVNLRWVAQSPAMTRVLEEADPSQSATVVEEDLQGAPSPLARNMLLYYMRYPSRLWPAILRAEQAASSRAKRDRRTDGPEQAEAPEEASQGPLAAIDELLGE